MKRTLLAVLAHPDDESYGIGGTLARYADEGVDVHVAIATDGAAGSIDERWQGDRSRLVEVRTQEVNQATKVLGATLHMMGYGDSGYIGDPANDNPESFINADRDESICQVVKLIRTLRPQVVITHDETGGYYHPDHIHCNTITTSAFFAAGKADEYPEIGHEPFQPDRLYYTAFSHRWVQVAMFMMRLRGQNPRRAGRNKDIDFSKIGVDPKLITTSIDYRRYWEIKRLASFEHGSQGGGTSFGRSLPQAIQKQLFGRETYIRAYPPPPPGLHEQDLFE
jgi:LmbE family N-acetylglucosaminyl deacetylase